MKFKDYYQIMGVSREASADEIKRAYRKLARKYHPDVSKEKDAEARFKEVGEAYEVLKDAEKRAAYDQLGASWKAGQDFRPPPDWDGGFEFHGGKVPHGDASAFSDFFESLFGHRFAESGRGQREFGVPAEDVFAKVLIDLEDSYRGSARAVTLKHVEPGPDGRPQVMERSLNVRIPKGIRPGQHIRLAGQRGAGRGHNGTADLYLEIEFRPHPLFRVEGKDVHLKLPLAPWEAALGTTVQAPTPTGLVNLKIPPGSSGGRVLRLKGRGIPSAQAGDLYVELQIALPPADTEKAQAAYRELERAGEFNPRAHLGGTDHDG
jgi:curved DNA-binding protein